MSADGLIVALGPVHDTVRSRLARFGELVIADRADSADSADSVDRELRHLLLDAIALIARGASVVDADLIDSAPRLRVIGRSGVGVELVDLAAATRRGIPVVVTPGTGSRAVAEGAFALILSQVKRLGRLTALVSEGAWSEREIVAVGDLDGACLGVIGYGRIGRRVAELGQGFGMRVVAYDPYAELPPSGDGVVAVDLEALIESADVVSVHAPLTARTRGMVGRSLLSRVKKGAVLVNCARGALLDLDAVYEALCDGRLGGVGLDVFEPEPPADHPLFHHPDVTLTPHVLGLSLRAGRLTFEAMADGMAEVLEGRVAPHVANPDVYDRAS